jgi:hypothetical protein
LHSREKIKCRSADEILEILMNGDVSEIEDLNDSDTEEMEDETQAPQLPEEEPALAEIEEDGMDEEVDEPDVPANGHEAPYCNFNLTSKKDIKWRRTARLGGIPQCWEDKPTSVPQDQLEPLMPVDYFYRYMPDSIFELMAAMTSMYALQKGECGFKAPDASEIKTLTGLHIVMGSLKLPRVRLYWDQSVRMNLFTENMTVNRFFKLRNMLHLVNNLEDRNGLKVDRLFKVRPIFDCLRNRCLELPLEKNLSVDEQMIPFKGHINIKQYIKGKP